MGQFRRIITVGAGGAPPAAETMGSTRVDWKIRNDITRVPPILRFLCPSPRRGSGSSRIHCKMKLPVRDLQLGGGIGGLSVSFAVRSDTSNEDDTRAVARIDGGEAASINRFKFW